jgi:hypothetical protein
VGSSERPGALQKAGGLDNAANFGDGAEGCTRHTSCGTIWKVDYQTRKREAQVSLANSQAVPLIHPDGKKLYCGGQWYSLNVYDTENLKRLTDVELGHSMAASGMRFVRSDKDL